MIRSFRIKLRLCRFLLLLLSPALRFCQPRTPPDGGCPGGNTAEGTSALFSFTGSGALHNTAVGDSALHDNTTGSRNTAFGDHTLFNNNGMNNIAIGASAGNNLTTGNNICIDNWESWANPTPFESGTNKR